MKKISVIVPCYNVSAYVEKCVISILSNTYKNLEIILINDGSKDDTGDKIERFKRMDDRILVIHQENKGLSETRNVGIEKASGEYIAFVDSDDWISNLYYENLITAMEANYDLVATSYNRVYQNTTLSRNLSFEGVYKSSVLKRRVIGLFEEELNDPSQADSMVTVWGKLYKNCVIKKNNVSFIDVQKVGTAEDLLFNLNYLSHVDGNSFVINLPLYNYRKFNASSFTSQYKTDLYMKWQTLFQLINVSVTNKEEYIAFQNRICLSIIGLGLNELSNPNGCKEIKKNLRTILSSEQYQLAYQDLTLRYFPLHWKLFFAAAKYQHITLLFFMLKLISKILNRKNT